jgi:hypothetical protein
LPFFIRVSSHQKFDYKPRYYDKEKALLDQRRKELGLYGPKEEHSSNRSFEELRDKGINLRARSRAPQNKGMNFNVMIIILSVCTLFLFLIGYKWFALLTLVILYIVFRVSRIRHKI